MRNLKLVLLSGLLAGGLGLAEAQAMPVANLAAIDTGVQADTVRWVCGPRRCWWRPNYVRPYRLYRPYAYYPGPRFYIGPRYYRAGPRYAWRYRW